MNNEINEPTIRLERFKSNPILSPTKNAWENKAVFNCAATTIDGRIALIYRAMGDDNISRFGLAYSDDGYTISERLGEPIFEPEPNSEYEISGVEDPRVTLVDDTYYMTYTAASHYSSVPKVLESDGRAYDSWRVRVSLASTRDFKTFIRYGVIISHIDSKDSAIFPKKYDNSLLIIHRVVPNMHLGTISNFDHFKERGPFLSPRPNMWDSKKIGVGAPPIETPFGWVLVYHGVDESKTYSLGLVLLDLTNPGNVIGRTDSPILTPQMPYERVGQVDQVVFSCGAVRHNNELLVYYGGGDQVIGVASVPFADILNWAESVSSKFKSRFPSENMLQPA